MTVSQYRNHDLTSLYLTSSLSQLLRDGVARQRHARTARQADAKKPYIAASFNPASMPPTFTLGNQMVYNGYENRALEPGQDYVVFILTELDSVSSASCPAAAP